ncbi:MAG: hypothetical protein JWP44_4900 [Mucilaginibacter sp.]|nr:hypothetical protein [Mucilaginibacter sp.]
MAHATTPHTQSQQNRQYDRTDLEPDQLEQTAGTGADASIYQNNAGAQTGTNRAPERFPDSAHHPNTEPQPVSYEGKLASRAPRANTQGISNHSSSEESSRQEKVVGERPDAQAGVNHSG